MARERHRHRGRVTEKRTPLLVGQHAGAALVSWAGNGAQQEDLRASSQSQLFVLPVGRNPDMACNSPTQAVSQHESRPTHCEQLCNTVLLDKCTFECDVSRALGFSALLEDCEVLLTFKMMLPHGIQGISGTLKRLGLYACERKHRSCTRHSSAVQSIGKRNEDVQPMHLA